jgi:ribose transport system substrate-binding protein
MTPARVRRQRLVAAFVAGACTVAVAACGRGESGTDASGDKKIKIAFAQAAFGNGWYEVQAEGVKAQAAKLGYDVDVVSASGKSVTQNSQIRNFITQRVDAVVMNPTDPRAVGTSLQALKQAKIPVVLVNTSVDPSLAGNYYCYVAENEVDNSSKIGAEMATALKAKYGSATIKARRVKGFPGDSNSARRDTGFTQGYNSVAGAPKLALLPPVYGHFNADGAVAPVRSVATANPDLKAIFTVTDSMLPGIQEALTGAGLWGKVVIGGYDARMSVVEQMKDNPDGPIVATVANLPHEQGTTGVDMLKKALDGVPKEKACPGGNHYIPPTVVTPKTAASYYKADVAY